MNCRLKSPRLILALALAAGACGPQRDVSTTKVINGLAVADGDFPFVVSINEGGCTGSFISATTLITAAHCTAGGVGYDGHEGETFVHRSYSQNNYPNDVAIVVFARDVAPATVELDLSSAATAGRTATVVGFGCAQLDRSGAGVKRYGSTTLEPSHNGMLKFTRRRVSGAEAQGSNISACYGDSGGPLLVDGKLAGVASHIADLANVGMIESYYTRVAQTSNVDFLTRAALRGADIPGLASPNEPSPGPGPGPSDPTPDEPPTPAPGATCEDLAIAHLLAIVAKLEELFVDCAIVPYGSVEAQATGHYAFSLQAVVPSGAAGQPHRFQSNFRLRRPADSAIAIAEMVPGLAFSQCRRR